MTWNKHPVPDKDCPRRPVLARGEEALARRLLVEGRACAWSSVGLEGRRGQAMSPRSRWLALGSAGEREAGLDSVPSGATQETTCGAAPGGKSQESNGLSVVGNGVLQQRTFAWSKASRSQGCSRIFEGRGGRWLAVMWARLRGRGRLCREGTERLARIGHGSDTAERGIR